MLRSLWTAATGMISQQTNVDTISNNLANVNTIGYKKEAAEFKSLLYQTIQKQSDDNNGDPKPYGVQVGLGVRNSAITSRYTQGTLTETGNDFDFAIEGDGFFAVQTEDGKTAYTRNGSFTFAVGAKGITLADSEGNPVLNTDNKPIVLNSKNDESRGAVLPDSESNPAVNAQNGPMATKGSYDTSKITVDEDGNLYYPDNKNVAAPIGQRISIVQFTNPAGLEKGSNSFHYATAASGEAQKENGNASLIQSKIRQGYLENSNVQAVDEMVNLIVAQRAYEMNSKIITASDEMLQQANNLR